MYKIFIFTIRFQRRRFSSTSSSDKGNESSAADGFASAPDIEPLASARKSAKSNKAKTLELTAGKSLLKSQINCILFIFVLSCLCQNWQPPDRRAQDF